MDAARLDFNEMRQERGQKLVRAPDQALRAGEQLASETCLNQ